MNDFHTHILYGIDDGANTIEESINILSFLSNNGVKNVFLTPHYVQNSRFNANNRKKKSIFNKLQKEVIKNNININMYLGNEVYINDNIVELIKKDEIMTLNDSKYILIELPVLNYDKNIKNTLHNLIVQGYIPIIAHPERYKYIDSKLELYKELKELGCLFQGNIPSLYGSYGYKPKYILTKMLKNDLIDFLGTDSHHVPKYKIKSLNKKLKRILKKEDKINKLLNFNLDLIIK